MELLLSVLVMLFWFLQTCRRIAWRKITNLQAINNLLINVKFCVEVTLRLVKLWLGPHLTGDKIT